MEDFGVTINWFQKGGNYIDNPLLKIIENKIHASEKLNNIPISENNIQQFQSYKNYEHQVTGAIENIIDELPQAFNELSGAGNDSGALQLYGQVLKLFSEGAQAEDAVTDTLGKEPEAAGGAATETAAEDALAKPTGKEAQVQEQGGRAEAMRQNPEAAASLEGELAGSKEGELSGKVQADQNALQEEASGENATSKSAGLDSRFIDNLRNLGISEETIKNYNEALKLSQSGESSPKLELAQKELLKELSASFEQSDLNTLGDKTVWKNIFSHEDYSKLLKDSISSQWTLKPGDVEKKENIDNLYQRLGNQIKGLTQTISNTLGAESKLGQAANNLQNNLDFMNQLNQMFQYVQLPLQMTGQNVHGDLFVYRNKHRKMSEDRSVSAVLHLDMEHMGPVDVYVKLLDNKVTTNFYVADEDVIDLINNNIHILNERLEKRGYTMNVSLKLHDDMDGQDAAVDEMLDVMKTPVISTASFDARA